MIWKVVLLILLYASPVWAGGNLSLFDLPQTQETPPQEHRKPTDKQKTPTSNVSPSTDQGQPLNPFAPAEEDEEDEEDMGC